MNKSISLWYFTKLNPLNSYTDFICPIKRKSSMKAWIRKAKTCRKTTNNTLRLLLENLMSEWFISSPILLFMGSAINYNVSVFLIRFLFQTFSNVFINLHKTEWGTCVTHSKFFFANSIKKCFFVFPLFYLWIIVSAMFGEILNFSCLSVFK